MVVGGSVLALLNDWLVFTDKGSEALAPGRNGRATGLLFRYFWNGNSSSSSSGWADEMLVKKPSEVAERARLGHGNL